MCPHEGSMRVRVHRGTQQIGGTCIELESQGKRIVLDLGLPLDANSATDVGIPDVEGLTTGQDDTLLGIIISHPHQDHWGILPLVDPKVPVYIGAAAARILRAGIFFGAPGIDLNPTGFLADGVRFEVGPFVITPYLNDHSAYDAYSLLIEANGKRVFYTGDIRGHGRKSALFERLIREPPSDIDVLLMEGTNVPEPGTPAKTAMTEDDLESQMVEAFQASQGMALVSFSAQNIDRLVTVYRAAIRSGRELVVDLYAATLAKATERRSIPQPGFEHLRVFVPQAQRVRVKREEAFERTEWVKPCRIYPEELQTRRKQLVMLFRTSMIGDVERAACLEDARLFWSLWPGYLPKNDTDTLSSFLERNGVPLEIHHTSGHAPLGDLQRLAGAIAAQRIVPIHTFAGDRFAEFFPRVERRADGSWWEARAPLGKRSVSVHL